MNLAAAAIYIRAIVATDDRMAVHSTELLLVAKQFVCGPTEAIDMP